MQTLSSILTPHLCTLLTNWLLSIYISSSSSFILAYFPSYLDNCISFMFFFFFFVIICGKKWVPFYGVFYSLFLTLLTMLDETLVLAVRVFFFLLLWVCLCWLFVPCVVCFISSCFCVCFFFVLPSSPFSLSFLLLLFDEMIGCPFDACVSV